MLRCIFVIIAVGAATGFAKEIRQSRNESAEFIGAAGCKSSSCHGGAGPKREQYSIWSRRDFHTRAFVILTDARSARIAEAVGGGEAPNNSKCTVCHSPFQSVAPTRLASTAKPDEGVSCENCHGAAAPWLRGHTRTDWTYATRVTAGMHDLRSLYVRANSCVACHQNIDNSLLKAGHPTMVFELDSQSINQPKHWREEDPWIGPKAWIVGQAVALREAAWHSRTDVDPSADSRETSLALAWVLAKTTAVEPSLPKISEPVSSDLEPIQREADDLARRAANWKPNMDSAMAMLQTLTATDSDFSGRGSAILSLAYRARRVVLALDRLMAALNQNRAQPVQLETELNLLKEDVRLPENFAPAKFAQDLRKFRSKL